MLSVVIPIYNGIKYVSELIEQIKNNSHPDAEFIVVDDGSTDGSKELLLKASKELENFKLVSKENGGVSTARNVGVENADGDYIWFVDCDDCIEPGSVAKICKLIKTGRDMYLFDVKFIANKKMLILESIENTEAFYLNDNANKFMLKNIMTNTRCNAVWNKIFKREIIVSGMIKFPVGVTNGEDTIFLLDYYDKIKSMQYVKEPLYIYILHSDSAVNNIRPETFDSIIEYHKKKIYYCEKYNFTEIISIVRNELVRTVFRSFFHIKCNKNCKSNRALKECIKKVIADEFIRLEFENADGVSEGTLKIYHKMHMKQNVNGIYYFVSAIAFAYNLKNFFNIKTK